jgi:glycosyltransferase involved in cell wall biosynthesis
MKVLFLTSVYNFNDKGNLNVDLIDTIAAHGHEVTVITPKERKYHLPEKIEHQGNITTLQFKCLNFRGKVNAIEKGISTLSLGYLYLHAIKKYFKGVPYDMVIYTTLPITYKPVLKYLKRKYGTYCYLQQKDFFPQSAVDLGMLSKESLPYKLFRHIEKGLFKASDKIGLMSQRNVEYIIKENPYLPSNIAEVCPNGIVPTPHDIVLKRKENNAKMREKLGIPKEAVVFLYGGNISRAQGIEFIECMFTKLAENPVPNTYFMMIGSGNGYEPLKKHVESLGIKNVQFIELLPKNEFDEILVVADVGMVFLDHRFTIANIPSRILAHMDMEQAVITATDSYTDYKELIEDNHLGLWCESNDADAMIINIKKLTEDKVFRENCAKNARQYLEKENTAEVAYSVIEKSYNEWKAKLS